MMTVVDEWIDEEYAASIQEHQEEQKAFLEMSRKHGIRKEMEKMQVEISKLEKEIQERKKQLADLSQ